MRKLVSATSGIQRLRRPCAFAYRRASVYGFEQIYQFYQNGFFAFDSQRIQNAYRQVLLEAVFLDTRLLLAYNGWCAFGGYQEIYPKSG